MLPPPVPPSPPSHTQAKKRRQICSTFTHCLQRLEFATFVEPILMEIMLSTKEVNEAARSTAFDILLAIGNRYLQEVG